MILIIGPQRYLSEIIMTYTNSYSTIALRHLDGRGTVSNKTQDKIKTHLIQ